MNSDTPIDSGQRVQLWRQQLLSAIFEEVEILTGSQAIGFVTLEDDQSLTLWRWELDAELAAWVDAEVGEARWNASKSL